MGGSIIRHRVRIAVPLALVSVLLAWAAAPSAGAWGAPDPGFGASGRVTTSIGFLDDGEAVLVQPDGRIVVAGTTSDASMKRAVLVRYLPDGTLDLGFGGGDGWVSMETGRASEGRDVALHPSGDLLLTGQIESATGDFDSFVARFNQSGSLNGAFGTSGIAEIDVSGCGCDDWSNAIAVQSDGRMVIGGQLTEVEYTVNGYVARLDIDGTPNIGFGIGGVTTNIGPTIYAEEIVDVAVPTGDDVVSLGRGSAGHAVMTVSRLYGSTGGVMPLFGGAGQTVIDTGETTEPSRLAIQPDQRIVVAGWREPSVGSFDGVLARLEASGAFDAGFGTGGVTTVDVAGHDDEIADVAVAAGGRIAAAGFSDGFGVFHFTPSGQLDPTFTSGDVLGGWFGDARGVAIQPDGKVVAAGSSLSGEIAVVRVSGGCTTTYSWIGGIGDWMNAANWTPPGIPDADGECADIGTGFAKLDTAASPTGVKLWSVGEIGGSGTLTVTDQFVWSAGAQYGSGKTVIPEGATLLVDGGSVVLGGCSSEGLCTEKRTIESAGTTRLLNGGTIRADDGTTFHVMPTGLFDITNDGGYTPGTEDGDPPSSFINDGILRKSAELTPGEPSFVIANYTGSGIIDVVQGALQVWTDTPIGGEIDPGDTMSTGTTEDVVLPGGVIVHLDFATAITNNGGGTAPVHINETDVGGSKKGYTFYPFRSVVSSDGAGAGWFALAKFWIDSSQLPPGFHDRVMVFNHGALVPDCVDATTVSPDPCNVQSSNGEGDIVIIVKTLRMGEPAPSGPIPGAPEPLGFRKREPISIDATTAQAQATTVTADDTGIGPAAVVPLGGDVAFVIAAGHEAVGDPGVGDAGAPLFAFDETSVDPTFRPPAGLLVITDGTNSVTLKTRPTAGLSGDRGNEILVTWSSTAEVPGCSACVFDLQVRSKLSGDRRFSAFKTWRNDRTGPSGVYKAKERGSYQFRARLENPTTGQTYGWSPATATVVVT